MELEDLSPAQLAESDSDDLETLQKKLVESLRPHLASTGASLPAASASTSGASAASAGRSITEAAASAGRYITDPEAAASTSALEKPQGNGTGKDKVKGSAAKRRARKPKEVCNAEARARKRKRDMREKWSIEHPGEEVPEELQVQQPCRNPPAVGQKRIDLTDL